jgi:hypothetical protein
MNVIGSRDAKLKTFGDLDMQGSQGKLSDY